MYRDHGMTFDSAGSWTFDNDTARNVITFGVDNGSSSHAENAKNDVFVVKRRSNLRNFVSPEKKFRNNVSKANKKFCLNFLYNANYSYLFVNGKEVFKYKAHNENVNVLTRFCPRSISNGFSATDSREVSLNGNVYDFSVDYISIDNLTY